MNQELSREALAVIEKVRKLLALANNNDNEHQAAAASAKAMELLEAYNLDIAAIGTAEKSGPVSRHDAKRKGGLYGWQRNLWSAVCKLNFCYYEAHKGLTKGSAYEHRVIGRKENVIGAEVMADYLQATIERLAQQWAKQAGFHSVFVREAIAYREGMTTRISERLYVLRQERLREEERKQKEQDAASRHPGAAPTKNALVLAEVIASEAELNADYVYGYEPGTHTKWRVERENRQKLAQAAADQALADRDAAELANPSLKAKRLAQEAEEAKRRQKELDDWLRKASKRSYNPRYRKETPEEARRRSPYFQSGYAKGDSVSLNRQINDGKATKLR